MPGKEEFRLRLYGDKGRSVNNIFVETLLSGPTIQRTGFVGKRMLSDSLLVFFYITHSGVGREETSWYLLVLRPIHRVFFFIWFRAHHSLLKKPVKKKKIITITQSRQTTTPIHFFSIRKKYILKKKSNIQRGIWQHKVVNYYYCKEFFFVDFG